METTSCFDFIRSAKSQLEYVMERAVLLGLVMWTILLLFSGDQALSQETKTRLVWKGCGISRKAFMAECAEE